MTTTIKITSHNHPAHVSVIDGGVVTSSRCLTPEDGEVSFYCTTSREIRVIDLEMGQTEKPISGLTFGQAIEALKGGKKVARAGWNGKGMFLFLVPGSTFKVNRPPLLGIYEEGHEVQYHAHIDMKTAQGYVVPWLASQADVLSEDWQVVAD